MNKKITIDIILLGMLISILHKIAFSWHLYWNFNWFDILMHYLGGFLIGLLVVLLIIRFKVLTQNKKIFFILIMSGVLVVGLSWELFELFFEMTNISRDKLDTMIDIVMDSLGGASSYFYVKNSFFIRDNLKK